jgi:hypothetical protein
LLMGTILLYSTNVFLKLMIQERYMGDVHYAWCSEEFDSAKTSAYSSASLVPPSSNPVDIFRDLRRDVQKQDRHSVKINQQKVSLTNRAIDWEKDGKISTIQKDEIIYMVANAGWDHWRPLVYIIPRLSVQPRLTAVPINLRAGFGNEYVVPDLKRSEFEVIEP